MMSHRCLRRSSIAIPNRYLMWAVPLKHQRSQNVRDFFAGIHNAVHFLEYHNSISNDNNYYQEKVFIINAPGSVDSKELGLFADVGKAHLRTQDFTDAR